MLDVLTLDPDFSLSSDLMTALGRHQAAGLIKEGAHWRMPRKYLDRLVAELGPLVPGDGQAGDATFAGFPIKCDETIRWPVFVVGRVGK